MRTKARVQFKKQERIQRQASERIFTTLSGDQKRILLLSSQGYEPGEISRELALDIDYVIDFMTGLMQRLMHDNVIISPEWRNVIMWFKTDSII